MLSDEKMVSLNHQIAIEAGKLTAGQVAKILRKRGLLKNVTARELQKYAPEWHHSGFFRKRSRWKMGKTYFFPPDVNLEELAEIIKADRLRNRLR